MGLLSFSENSSWLNAGLFALGAVVVWFAGTKLERLADEIARRTGLGHAFVGWVGLAAATSLPEIATTVTAVWIGNISLAVHNLLGSVVFNTVVLVIADILVGRAALSNRAPSFVLLIEGLGVVFILGLVVAGGAVGQAMKEPWLAPAWLLEIGLWEALLLFAYSGVMYATYTSQSAPRWRPIRAETEPKGAGGISESDGEDGERKYKRWSSRAVYLAFAGASLVVLVGGWLLTRAGDVLATQTGLGSGFVGFALLAIATTLPEISTTLSAARANNDEMAFSNIFGSSAFVLLLLAVVGLASGSDAIIQTASPSAQFAAGLGILVTCIYLWGLLERRDRTVLRMGWDSAAVLVVTVAGTAILYALK